MIRSLTRRTESETIAPRGRIVVGLLVVAGVLLFALANTHLVYVAIDSQPDCVPHIKHDGTPAAAGRLKAAQSAC